jgi:hypothetical protein
MYTTKIQIQPRRRLRFFILPLSHNVNIVIGKAQHRDKVESPIIHERSEIREIVVLDKRRQDNQ